MRCSKGTFHGIKGTELYYQVWHPVGTPRAVVVGVHGHGDHSGGLRNVVQHLSDKGYIWYGFDLRGHGRSPGLRGHVQSWADFHGDLKAFLCWIKGREPEMPIFVLGHSLGGLIGLEYALRSPQGLQGIITISPALAFNGLSFGKRLLLTVISLIKPDFTVTLPTDYLKLTRDAEMIESLSKDPLRHGKMTAGFASVLFRCQDWVLKHASKLRVPLLMLYGVHDAVTPSKENRQFINSVSLASTEFHEYENTQHRPFDDVNREEVLGHISAWLDRQLA